VVLAIAPGEAMLGEAEHGRCRDVLAGRGRGSGDDSVPPSRSPASWRIGFIQNEATDVHLRVRPAVTVAVALYLWGPSSTPPGQKPLTILSSTNFTEFETAFDTAPGPRLVLLLSPT
jgi:hypothetical protein